jgi:hypothetical protein
MSKWGLTPRRASYVTSKLEFILTDFYFIGGLFKMAAGFSPSRIFLEILN